ncbi:MAG: M15 family metallopeptidase [Armatimonadaceae bacterium]
MQNSPILPWIESPGWRHIPVDECGEALQVVPDNHPRLLARPVYHQRKIPGAPDCIRVRQGVLERLIRVSHALPEPWGLLVHDGHRPLAVQQALWDERHAEVQSLFPDGSQELWDHETARFVARPVSDPSAPPPHRSGGAVDVSLFNRDTGEIPDFGSPFDSATDASATRFFEETSAQPEARRLRRILFHTMSAHGFTNYHAEWWHYDFGNQRWAHVAGHTQARYGLPGDE